MEEVVYSPVHEGQMRLLDLPFVSKMVFFPQSTDIEPTLWVNVNGLRLGCHSRNPHSDAITVVYFHGNGELAAECDAYLAPFFLRMGVNICFVEYRGYGASQGKAALTTILGDGERVVEALGVKPERIVAFGRSLGSLYAVELARRLPRLAGLILESGIANLFELSPVGLLGRIGRWAAGAMAPISLFNQRAKLYKYTGPLLVLHTAGDQIVDKSHAERLFAWGAGSKKQLVLFDKGDHNSILETNLDGYRQAVQKFLTKVGQSPP